MPRGSERVVPPGGVRDDGEKFDVGDDTFCAQQPGEGFGDAVTSAVAADVLTPTRVNLHRH